MKNIINFFKTTGDNIVDNFGFSDLTDFFHSMIHTKYLFLTLPISVVSFAIVEEWFGITSAMFVAFGVMATVELITGLWGSRVAGNKWTSRKFSRFGLKILVWLSLILVANTFKISYEDQTGVQNFLIFQLFNWLHGVLIVYITMEYIISILENYSRITGKKQNRLLTLIKKKFDQFLGAADNATDFNVQDAPTEVKTTPTDESNPEEVSKSQEL